MTPEHLLERYLLAKGKVEDEVERYLTIAQDIFHAES
jgi:hypothetical protein